MGSRSLPPEPPVSTGRTPRPGLTAWILAWRNVVLHPYGEIPRPPLPAESEPIPAHLGLHCPDCGYSLTGLCERRCPECGELFTVQRAWTYKIQREPEYILRYRFDPGDIRCVVGIVLLVAAALPAVWMVLSYAPPWWTSKRSWVYRQSFKLVLLPPAIALMCTLRGDASLRLFLGLSALWFLTAWAAVWVVQ